MKTILIINSQSKAFSRILVFLCLPHYVETLYLSLQSVIKTPESRLSLFHLHRSKKVSKIFIGTMLKVALLSMILILCPITYFYYLIDKIPGFFLTWILTQCFKCCHQIPGIHCFVLISIKKIKHLPKNINNLLLLLQISEELFDTK